MMNTMFNPAPLTIDKEQPGLLDIMITWHSSNGSNSLQPGETQIKTITKSATVVGFTIESKAPGTGKSYTMTKSVTLNTKYPLQEYKDKDFYVLFDSGILTAQTSPIKIEPYCVLFDDDAGTSEPTTKEFNVGGGLYMDRTGDGFEFRVVPPMLTVTQIYEQVGFRTINGIAPSSGDIQIRGLDVVNVLVS